MIKSHKDLTVWQKSIDLADTVYTVTESFPRQEQFGLVSQMRRASVSVASNIAEGSARNTTKDYIRFLSLARGSLAELETQIVIAARRKFIETPTSGELEMRSAEISRMLYSLQKSLTTKIT